MNRKMITTAALLAVMTTGALADRIDQRQVSQAERIQQARRAGELTFLEAGKLKVEQARIAAMERRAKSDGIVTRHEAHDIRQAQNAANRHIYLESHDSQKSWLSRWR